MAHMQSYKFIELHKYLYQIQPTTFYIVLIAITKGHTPFVFLLHII